MKSAQCMYHHKTGWSGLEDCKGLDSEFTLVFAFFAPKYRDHDQVWRELRDSLPQSVIVGCSTSGEIYSDEMHDLSISVGICQFEHSTVRRVDEVIKESSESLVIGKKISGRLISGDLKGLIVFADGLKTNGSMLTNGIKQIIGSEEVAIGGGLAGDGNHFKDTWIIGPDGMPMEEMITGIGLYGKELNVSAISKGGWDIFGPERKITKSHENVVYEIDDEPALDLYKNYLGAKAANLPSSGLLFPLQIRNNSLDQNRLVRTLLGIDEEAHALIFAGDVPEGCLAQLMRANFERLIDAAGDAGEIVNDAIKASTDSFSLAISCVGRRLVLGARVEEELEMLRETLENQKVVGFYSYGEIGSQSSGSACDLHNQSMTVIGIEEKKAA